MTLPLECFSSANSVLKAGLRSSHHLHRRYKCHHRCIRTAELRPWQAGEVSTQRTCLGNHCTSVKVAQSLQSHSWSENLVRLQQCFRWVKPAITRIWVTRGCE